MGCDRGDPQDTKAASAGWYLCSYNEGEKHTQCGGFGCVSADVTSGSSQRSEGFCFIREFIFHKRFYMSRQAWLSALMTTSAI